MAKKLDVYLARIYDIVHSRRGVTVEAYNSRGSSNEHSAAVRARLRYWDDSMLQLTENLIEEDVQLRKEEYVYHYQAQDGSLIFRYDNVPHYPDLPTHPHHKHVGAGAAERVEATQPPQLTDVLREIDALLTPPQNRRMTDAAAAGYGRGSPTAVGFRLSNPLPHTRLASSI